MEVPRPPEALICCYLESYDRNRVGGQEGARGAQFLYGTHRDVLRPGGGCEEGFYRAFSALEISASAARSSGETTPIPKMPPDAWAILSQ
jgi:hypothetical protein